MKLRLLTMQRNLAERRESTHFCEPTLFKNRGGYDGVLNEIPGRVFTGYSE